MKAEVQTAVPSFFLDIIIVKMQELVKHKIDWLNMPGYKGETYNPIIGCEKISPGCRECYAEKMAGRLANIESTKYYGNVTRFENMAGGNEFEDPDQWKYKGWNGKTHFVESAIDKPLHWKKPRMIFVCSMSDLFHETTPFHQITEVINIITACPQHIFILLTKRPEVMRDYFDKNPPLPFGVLKNMWLGVTAENQKEADKRIPILLDIPASKRFVSIEPMLGKIDISTWFYPKEYVGMEVSNIEETEFSTLKQSLNWVICGGESGHKARPMHPDWVRSIRDQCKEANVPYFFKQWGEYIPSYSAGSNIDSLDMWMKSFGHAWVKRSHKFPDGMTVVKVGKSKSGSELDGHHHKEFPR